MNTDTTTPVPEFDPLRTVVFYGVHLPQRVTFPYDAKVEQRKVDHLRANRGLPLTDTTTGADDV